jgi:glycosyltransferase involved in cell wall biosynthesis
MNPRILFVSPGPVMEIKAGHYEELSKYFAGAVITSSGSPGVFTRREVAGFAWHCMKFKLKRKSILNVYFFIYAIQFSLRSRFLGNSFDLVVTYDPLKTGLIGMICAAILGAKFAPEVNGVYTSPAEYLDDAEKFGTRIKKFFYPKIEKLVLSRADGIKLLFPNQIAPFDKVSKGKVIRWFPNNVNIDPFLRLENNTEKEQILFAGFPFKRKGVDILIAAFKLIAEKHPSWKLKILGWFPDPTALNQAIGGHPQIFHHKPVMPSEMPFHIGQCSIFVLPSRSEAMGRILVETMAAGKPRIGANVDGIPAVIKEGEDGLLFETDDVNDLAKKMDILIANPELRARIGRAARERAKMEFSSLTYFNNLINFYNEIMK